MMMHHISLRRTMALILSLLLMVGCSGGNSTPSTSDIEAALNKKIFENGNNQGLKIANFDVKVQENKGSETEPEFHTRFIATLKFSEPLYSERTLRYKDESYSVLEKKIDKGEDFKVSGVAISVLHVEQWKTEFKNLEVSDKGKDLFNKAEGTYPRKRFSDNAVMEGSKELRNLEQKIAKWEHEQQLKREAELKKMRAEAAAREEKIRIENEAREARLRAEREAKAAKERARRTRHIKEVKNFIKSLHGVWEGVGSSPIRLTVRGEKLGIDYAAAPQCPTAHLYVNIEKSSAMTLVTNQVMAAPCKRSNTVILTRLDTSTLRIKFPTDTPAILTRQ